MEYEFRPYQEEAVANVLRCFEETKLSSVMLESPVGSGKTLMALKVIHRLQEHLGRRLKINWVAPRRHLLQQVMEANRELYQEDIRPVSLFEKCPPPAEMVILDEAHHEATQSCVLLYEKMHNAWTLGLSATPLRTDRMKLSFQETVSTCSIGRLIREGYLSPFHSYLLPTYDPRSIAECYLASPEKWGKSLVFFQTVRECHDFCEMLSAAGIPCDVVTATSDKDSQLEAFLNNRTRVVANVSMLTEGFDQPDVQSIFARDASRLPTIQMCGRGLRLFPGKEKCNIIQSGNSSFLFERVAPALNAFRLMNGQWLALKDGTEEINSVIAQSLKLMEKRDAASHQPRRPVFTPPTDNPSAQGENASSRSNGSFSSPYENTSNDISQTAYYQAFGETYKELYIFYAICNRLCWNSSLPQVVIFMNRRNTPSHVMAFATPLKLQSNGVNYPGICINLRNCSRITPESFLAVFLHEMTHIWQFAQHRRGGHGADFYRELARIGIREKEGLCQNGSPADAVLREARQNHSDLCFRLRKMLETDIPQPRDGDIRFFAEQVLGQKV